MMRAAPSESEKPVAGTRPEGVSNDAEAARYVREMFSRIAPRYDLLNYLLSFSQDHIWRRRTAQNFTQILSRNDARALDVCCGTGDMAFALEQVARAGHAGQSSGARVFATDFATPMLEAARAKARRTNSRVEFFAADTLALPFEDASFDLLTTAFGFRNLADYEKGLREFARVLRRGGEMGILEFTEPRSGFFAPLARFYLRRVLPKIGGAISGSAAAYSYLPSSVEKFPGPEELAARIKQASFAEARFVLWNFGTVALHTARRR